MHVDGVAADLLVKAVQAVLQLFARQAATACLHEAREQVGLAPRQFDRLAFEPGLAAGRIEAQRAGFDQVHAAAAGATQQCMQARHKLAEIEGFHQVVVCASLQASDAVLGRVARDQFVVLDDAGPSFAAFNAMRPQHRSACLDSPPTLTDMPSSADQVPLILT